MIPSNLNVNVVIVGSVVLKERGSAPPVRSASIQKETVTSVKHVYQKLTVSIYS